MVKQVNLTDILSSAYPFRCKAHAKGGQLAVFRKPDLGLITGELVSLFHYITHYLATSFAHNVTYTHTHSLKPRGIEDHEDHGHILAKL